MFMICALSNLNIVKHNYISFYIIIHFKCHIAIYNGSYLFKYKYKRTCYFLEYLDELAVRRLFMFLKENLLFDSLQDELEQKQILTQSE